MIKIIDNYFYSQDMRVNMIEPRTKWKKIIENNYFLCLFTGKFKSIDFLFKFFFFFVLGNNFCLIFFWVYKKWEFEIYFFLAVPATDAYGGLYYPRFFVIVLKIYKKYTKLFVFMCMKFWFKRIINNINIINKL